MKYCDTAIVLQEIPDQITLAINISGCPIKCDGCHSKYLQDDIGEELNSVVIDKLIEDNPDITCICFMGGDADPNYIYELAKHIHTVYSDKIKIGWYSGRDKFDIKMFDFINYIKLGPYIQSRGPLNSKTTNQILLYRDDCGNIMNLTNKFQNN